MAEFVDHFIAPVVEHVAETNGMKTAWAIAVDALGLARLQLRQTEIYGVSGSPSCKSIT